jgi:hypothetical protein
MKTRPKRLIALSLCLLAIAASLPLQIMMMYGHTLFEIEAIAAKMAPLNWGIMLLAPLTAYLVFQASPWLMAALPSLTLLVFYNNWLVGSLDADFSPLSAGLASAAFVMLLAGMISREVLQTILNPNSRWWLTPLRKKLMVPVRLKLLTRNHQKKSQEAYNEFYIRTYDLSEGGAFIPLEQSGSTAGMSEAKTLQAFNVIFKNLAVGTQCYICLPLKDVSFIQCRAEIVRCTQGRGEYPAGVGVRFLGLSWAEKRRISGYLEQTA